MSSVSENATSLSKTDVALSLLEDNEIAFHGSASYKQCICFVSLLDAILCVKHEVHISILVATKVCISLVIYYYISNILL